MRHALRICPLCEATCGLRLHVEGDAVVRVDGDAEDVFSAGFLCPKGARIHDLHVDPDRLASPLVRRDGELQPATWEEAFEVVAAGLGATWAAHGRDAVALYLGNPNVHHLAGALWAKPLIKAFRTRNLYSASTLDQMARHVASGLVYGHPDDIPLPDVDRTDLLVIVGANPLESNGSLATAPDWPGRLRALGARGGRLVVIDPVRTRTADLADVHLPIRPGADALLLAAAAHEAIGADPAHAALRGALARFTPERVASRCGIPAEAIRALAAELRQTPRAVVYGRLGSQASRFGTLASWLVDVLNAVTGHTDVAGGCLFPRPPHHVSRPDRAFATGRHTSRVRGLPEARGELPAATLADEILEPGGVRALVTVAGNPALSVPDSDRVELALASLDLLVCVDPYVNETSRFAHVVLPPEPPLCRPHYDLVFSALSLRTVARWSDATFPLPPGALAEWEILARLVAIASGLPAATPAANVDDFVLGVLVKQLVDDRTSRLHGQDPAAIVRSLGPERGPARMVDALLRAGPFGDGTATGLDLARLRTEPHGLDLGPLEPRGVRVDLLPPALVADLDRLEASLEEPVAEVVLVGRRDVRSNNSWGHNAPHLVRGPDRCTAWVHPDDAEAWGLEAGGAATIASASGEVRAPVEVTDRVRRGVVSLPHGWGHDRPGTRLSVASTRPGVNANRLTDTAVVDPLSGNAELFGVPITVCPG